jgi:DNA-binding Lrp family transcriptional regulator
MPGPLKAVDIRILQALCEIGPRNMSDVARKVGISRELLQFRLKRMRSNPRLFLRMHASIYHTYLGLRKAVVILEATPGEEQLLFECLRANGFWLYVCRSYGMGEGCTAIYAVPIEHCADLEEFIYETVRLHVARSAHIYWSTCFQGGRITSEWFDCETNKWVFNWDSWVKEVQDQSTDLPYTLIEPKGYPICADELDVKMLEGLEYDATVGLNELARSLKITPQAASFRFNKRLLKRNLIEGYQIFIMPYEDTPSVMALFIISFPSYEAFAKFARSLLNKSFVITMGKVIGENSFLVEVFLPNDEFRKFVDTLSKMARMQLVCSYKYAIQDLRVRKRQTIFDTLFKENAWIYDHKSHMEALQRTISKLTSI